MKFFSGFFYNLLLLIIRISKSAPLWLEVRHCTLLCLCLLLFIVLEVLQQAVEVVFDGRKVALQSVHVGAAGPGREDLKHGVDAARVQTRVRLTVLEQVQVVAGLLGGHQDGRRRPEVVAAAPPATPLGLSLLNCPGGLDARPRGEQVGAGPKTTRVADGQPDEHVEHDEHYAEDEGEEEGSD